MFDLGIKAGFGDGHMLLFPCHNVKMVISGLLFEWRGDWPVEHSLFDTDVQSGCLPVRYIDWVSLRPLFWAHLRRIRLDYSRRTRG